MTAPIQANWYGQGFVAIRVDGLSVHDMPCTFREVRNSGADVLAEGTWNTPKGDVHLRLVLRSDDDKLLMQAALATGEPGQAAGNEAAGPSPRLSRTAEPESGHGHARVHRGHVEHQPERAGTAVDPPVRSNSSTSRIAAAGRAAWCTCPRKWNRPPRKLGTYPSTVSLRGKPGKRARSPWACGTSPSTAMWPRCDATSARPVRGSARIWRVRPRPIGTKGIPAARLPEEYARALAQRAAERRRPTPYDEMTGQIVTPHVKWARPLVGGPVRTLVVGKRWDQRETVELAQRLEMDYQTVSFSGPESLIDPRVMYLYGSYDDLRLPAQERDRCALRAEREAGRRARLHDPHGLSAGDSCRRRRAGESSRRSAPARGWCCSGTRARWSTRSARVLRSPPGRPGVVPLEKFAGHTRAGRPENVRSREAYTFGKGRVLVFHYTCGLWRIGTGHHARPLQRRPRRARLLRLLPQPRGLRCACGRPVESRP